MGARKNLKFLRVYDKVIERYFTQEALQIEATFLKECVVFATYNLLRWAGGNDDTRPSLLKSFLEQVELIVSSFAFPFALQVFTFHDINDMSVDEMRISY